MKTTTKGARVTKAGNVVGMTKAYAVVINPLGKATTAVVIAESNNLADARVIAMRYEGEVYSSGGVMMTFKKEEK